MFEQESVWIKKEIEALDLTNVETVLDVGSSSLNYRTVKQPFIDNNIFAPLREKSKKIFHFDSKKQEGVDIIGEINTIDEIDKTFDLLLCCSLLEHVAEPDKVADKLMKIINKGGYAIITVPRNFIYHLDPIDTGFRPTPNNLAALFKNFKIIKKHLLEINGLGADWKCSYKNRYKQILKIIFRFEFKDFKNIPIIIRKYKMSCIIVKKV